MVVKTFSVAISRKLINLAQARKGDLEGGWLLGSEKLPNLLLAYSITGAQSLPWHSYLCFSLCVGLLLLDSRKVLCSKLPAYSTPAENLKGKKESASLSCSLQYISSVKNSGQSWVISLPRRTKGTERSLLLIPGWNEEENRSHKEVDMLLPREGK